MADDRRVKHTKKRIRDAMTKCLKTQSLDKVTVKSICDEADINRSTFYVYYTDPLDLYQAMETDFISELTNYYIALKSNKTSYEVFLKELVKNISANSDTYYALLVTNSASLKKTNLDFLSRYELWGKVEDEKVQEYFEEFIVSGIQNILLKWITAGKTESEEFIAELIYKFTSNY